MKIKDLMTTEVLTIGTDASLKEAARRMVEAGVSGLVVTSAEGEVEGIITEADFVKGESRRRAANRARLLRWLGQAEEISSTELRVGDVMTGEVTTLGADVDHAEAARVMRREEIKRVPIVDSDGNLVGIVSRSDILRAFVRPDSEILDEIRDRVMLEVLWIDPDLVDLTSVDGNVTLEGEVETKSDAILLEDLVRRLDGVASVSSKLSWELDNTKVEMAPPRPGDRLPGLIRSQRESE